MPAELRPSQALHLWHDVVSALVRGNDQDLTARQMTVLLTVYRRPHGSRTGRRPSRRDHPALDRGRLGLLAAAATRPTAQRARPPHAQARSPSNAWAFDRHRHRALP
jgi:hypothetical protein